ncbi:hypothetical protein LC193_09365 [Streptomyces marincola]|nr:hypothetical protein LC193_09365 [Streptomyces marincola]
MDGVSSWELADFLRHRREDLRPEDVLTEASRPPGHRAPVRHIPGVRKSMHHPTLGELAIDRHTLDLPGSGCSLVMYTAEAGSPSAASLKSL